MVEALGTNLRDVAGPLVMSQRDARGPTQSTEAKDGLSIVSRCLFIIIHCNYLSVRVAASSPAVGRWDDQRVADAGPTEAAAQLVEQAVGQRLQGQRHQQGAEEQAVGRLQDQEWNENSTNHQGEK